MIKLGAPAGQKGIWQPNGRPILAEEFDSQRIDQRALGDIGHEDRDFDDMRGFRTGVAQARAYTLERNSELLDGAIRNCPVLLDANGARNPDVPVGAHNVAIVTERLWLAGNEVAFDHMGIPSLGYAKIIQSISLVRISVSPVLLAIQNPLSMCDLRWD